MYLKEQINTSHFFMTQRAVFDELSPWEQSHHDQTLTKR